MFLIGKKVAIAADHFVGLMASPAIDDALIDADSGAIATKADLGRRLVAKIPHTRRWQVTPLGHRALGVCVRLYYHGLATAA